MINSRYQEAANSKINMILILVVNLPQILASIIVLSMYWDINICTDGQDLKWKIWATLSTLRMSLYTAIIVVMFYWKDYFEARPQSLMQITSYRNILDAMGLVWFIIGVYPLFYFYLEIPHFNKLLF